METSAYSRCCYCGRGQCFADLYSVITVHLLERWPFRYAGTQPPAEWPFEKPRAYFAQMIRNRVLTEKRIVDREPALIRCVAATETDHDAQELEIAGPEWLIPEALCNTTERRRLASDALNRIDDLMNVLSPRNRTALKVEHRRRLDAQDLAFIEEQRASQPPTESAQADLEEIPEDEPLPRAVVVDIFRQPRETVDQWIKRGRKKLSKQLLHSIPGLADHFHLKACPQRGRRRGTEA